MQALSPSPPYDPYVSRAEFVEFRNLQDQQLKDEFGSVGYAIGQVRQELGAFKEDASAQFAKVEQELDEFKADVRTQFVKVERELGEFKEEVRTQFAKVERELGEFKADVRTQFAKVERELGEFKEDVKTQFKEVNLELLRMSARFRNYTIKNPAMTITPVVAYKSGDVVSPNPGMFPRNVKDFYAMRDRPNDRRTKMLSYLVAFYDVQLDDDDHHHEESQSDDDDSEASDADGSASSPPHRKQTVNLRGLAVETLETILGLNEENFIGFKERAAALARRSPRRAVKRPDHRTRLFRSEECLPRSRISARWTRTTTPSRARQM